jgi:hypothetical protein
VSDGDHYVYLYRDKNRNPIYVGRGEKAERSYAHTTSRAHNQTLSELLKDGSHSIEIAGPFQSAETAAAVEAALISALSGTPRLNELLANKNEGDSQGRFRPIGVPLSLENRISETPLKRENLKQLASEFGPVLVVYVNDQDFSDGRTGFNPAQIPTDQKIVDRIEKYWC